MEQSPFHAATEREQSLDEWILSDPEASFIMKMEGDSMRDHGIYHDDMLIIERASEAYSNDFVITVQDGAWSIHKYAELMDTCSDESVHIEAKVKAVIRKYE